MLDESCPKQTFGQFVLWTSPGVWVDDYIYALGHKFRDRDEEGLRGIYLLHVHNHGYGFWLLEVYHFKTDFQKVETCCGMKGIPGSLWI